MIQSRFILIVGIPGGRQGGERIGNLGDFETFGPGFKSSLR